MAIEKMTFVNVLGDISFLDKCILKLIDFNMFHIEKIKNNEKISGFKNLNEQNPYTEPLNKINRTLKILNISIKETEIKNLNPFEEKFEDFKQEEIFKLEEEIENINKKITYLKDSLNIIEHMKNLDVKIKSILKTNHIEAHFGKLPKDSYLKLEHIKQNDFFFIKQDIDEDFCWGFYISKKIDAKKAFEFFKELFFIEISIPKEVEENPQIEIEKINREIDVLKTRKKDLEIKKEEQKNKNKDSIKKTYIKIKTLHDAFSYRRFAIFNSKQFRICGFIPTKQIMEFKKIFENDNEVVYEFLEEQNEKYTPPVKLKTSRIFRPFEMYIKTYGTPQYKSFNPSSLVGFIYSIIFGIMFGDLGQGFLLFVGGFIAHKKTKNKLGLILTRCGFCSMIFGLVFDSLFGIEGIFKNFWKTLGIKILPFHLLNPSNSIPILMISCLIGVAIILVSISINIILNLKNKNVGEALFSHNGLAGLVFYGGFAASALFLILFKKNIFSYIFIILIIILPVCLIFLNIPLSNLLEKNSEIKNKREKFTVSSAIFDMIDIFLSYFTNTLSFLRVGGLALSHAALMLVVMKFAKMAATISTIGTISSIVVMILGNIFIIVLESLIVSIQALRLIYYEIFSRFYKSNGKPFSPIKIDYNN